MLLVAKWTVQGQIVERRELTSQKNAEWRGYVVKVASHGHTFELHVTAEQYQQLGVVPESEVLEFQGRFEAQGHGVKLIVTAADKVRSRGAA